MRALNKIFPVFMPENKELWFVGDLVKGQAKADSRINMIPNVGVPILWKLCSELVIGKVWPPSKNGCSWGQSSRKETGERTHRTLAVHLLALRS